MTVTAVKLKIQTSQCQCKFNSTLTNENKKRKDPEDQHVREIYSNFSSSCKRDKTTSLFVSSISPARKISSRIAYTYKAEQKKVLTFSFPRSYLVKIEDKI